MKRIIILFGILFSLFLLSGGNLFAQQAKIEKSQIKGLIREYKGKTGFEGINLGSMLLSLAKLSDDEDAAAFKGIKSMTIADLSGCDSQTRGSFKKDFEKLIGTAQVLMEARDEGEAVRMYGNCLPDGSTIENLIIYCEEDCTLICLWGTIDSKNIEMAADEVKVR